MKLATLLLLSVLLGCTTPERTTYVVTGGTVVTVAAAMNAFADAWVAKEVTASQKSSVDVVYDRYYAAIQVEKSAVLAYKANQLSGGTNTINIVSQAANSAQADLLGLIYQFLPAKRLATLKGTP